MRDRDRDRERLVDGHRGAGIRTACRTTYQHAYILRRIDRPGRLQFYAGLPRVVLRIRIAVLGAGFDPCRTTVSARVTDDVKQGNRSIRGVQFVLVDLLAGEEGLEYIALHGIAFHGQGGTHRTQRTFAAYLCLQVVGHEPYTAVPALVIQFVDRMVGAAVQSVVHRHLSAALRYAVATAGLRVVVVVIVLIGGCHELILTLVVEQRMTQRILHRAVRLLCIEIDRIHGFQREVAGFHHRFAVAGLLNAV